MRSQRARQQDAWRLEHAAVWGHDCAAMQCCSGERSTYAELGRSDAPPPQRGQHCGQLAGGTPGSCCGFQALLLLLCCPLLLSVGILRERRRGLTGPSTWQLADRAIPLWGLP